MLKLLKSYIPLPLPVGIPAFNKWADEIVDLAGPIADKDSLIFVLASLIRSSPDDMSHASQQFFVRRLRKAAANQVASQVFVDIKTKQMEAQKAAEEAAKLAEVTAAPEAVTNETTQG